MSKILIVEDEHSIAELERDYLELSGFEVEVANDGQTGLEQSLSGEYDLIILDLMLPEVDGFEICRQVRVEKNTPIIMVSAKKEDIDKIRGLGLGADDYMTKPFSPSELVARVKAQLRRSTQYNENRMSKGEIIDFAGLVLNRSSHECIYNERALTLTPLEFDILWLLCENRGKVISSEELFRQVWKEEYYKNSNNTVMVHIRHLREKMSGPTGKSDFIKTVWGVGYKVEE